MTVKNTNIKTLKVKDQKKVKYYLNSIIEHRKKQINLFQKNIIDPIKRNIDIVKEVKKGNLPYEHLQKHSINLNNHLRGLLKDSEGI